MKKRRMAAVTSNGRIVVIERDIPEIKPGTVLVEVHASLVSPGTELGGWANLSNRRGAEDTGKEPRVFGYSNAGIVIETASDVTEFSAGDRVACVGNGFACHADTALVPHNLCVALPDAVTFAQGSYAMLSATALFALRRADLKFGEAVAIVGMGLVGQLAAQLHQIQGNYVIGWDVIDNRLAIAEKAGIAATVNPKNDDVVARTNEFTNGYGLDGAVFAMQGDATQAMEDIVACMKLSPDGHRMGTVVVVGGIQFPYKSTLYNVDIRRASRIGPGYHDAEWEFGRPYPDTFMRWTSRTNLELCMRLIAEGRLNVDALTTHSISLNTIETEVDRILDSPNDILGLVIKMR